MRTSLAICVALLFPAGLLAQQEPQQGGAGPSPFDQLDKDRDSAISTTEAQAHPVVSQNFGVADKNGDRVLTREEFDSSFTTSRPSLPSESESPATPAVPEE